MSIMRAHLTVYTHAHKDSYLHNDAWIIINYSKTNVTWVDVRAWEHMCVCMKIKMSLIPLNEDCNMFTELKQATNLSVKWLDFTWRSDFYYYYLQRL